MRGGPRNASVLGSECVLVDVNRQDEGKSAHLCLWFNVDLPAISFSSSSLVTPLPPPPPPPLRLSLSLSFPSLTKPFGERRTFPCRIIVLSGCVQRGKPALSSALPARPRTCQRLGKAIACIQISTAGRWLKLRTTAEALLFFRFSHQTHGRRRKFRQAKQWCISGRRGMLLSISSICEEYDGRRNMKLAVKSRISLWCMIEYPPVPQEWLQRTVLALTGRHPQLHWRHCRSIEPDADALPNFDNWYGAISCQIFTKKLSG